MDGCLGADEVDSLLGARRSMEHEATTAMKTEFMQAGWAGWAGCTLESGNPNNTVAWAWAWVMGMGTYW